MKIYPPIRKTTVVIVHDMWESIPLPEGTSFPEFLSSVENAIVASSMSPEELHKEFEYMRQFCEEYHGITFKSIDDDYMQMVPIEDGGDEND